MKKRILVLAVALALIPLTAWALTLTGGSYPFAGHYTNGCMSEDDQGHAQFTGNMAPGESISVEMPLCPDGPPDYGPGGLAIRASVLNAQPTFLVTLTSPSGIVYSANQPTWGAAVVRCKSYLGYPDPDPYGTNILLEGGTWIATVKNVGTKVQRTVDVDFDVHMAYNGWSTGYCPAGDLQ